MATLAWSNRVGERWAEKSSQMPVTIRAEHVHAGMLMMEFDTGDQEWISGDAFVAFFEPLVCGECGAVLREVS